MISKALGTTFWGVRSSVRPVFSYSNWQLAQYTAMATASVYVLIIAWLLPASSRGVGTHEQIGLPACTFLKLTGIPCPGCGLTTSFAHAAKLHFFSAFLTQPFGFAAFFITV